MNFNIHKFEKTFEEEICPGRQVSGPLPDTFKPRLGFQILPHHSWRQLLLCPDTLPFLDTKGKGPVKTQSKIMDTSLSQKF